MDGARTVLAPFGLPTVLKKHCPAPLLLVRRWMGDGAERTAGLIEGGEGWG